MLVLCEKFLIKAKFSSIAWCFGLYRFFFLSHCSSLHFLGHCGHRGHGQRKIYCPVQGQLTTWVCTTWFGLIVIFLIIRFHRAVYLFSNRLHLKNVVRTEE